MSIENNAFSATLARESRKRSPFSDLAAREILDTLCTHDLYEFCRWNDRYNVPEAWDDDPGRTAAENYWLEVVPDEVSHAELENLIARFEIDLKTYQSQEYNT